MTYFLGPEIFVRFEKRQNVLTGALRDQEVIGSFEKRAPISDVFTPQRKFLGITFWPISLGCLFRPNQKKLWQSYSRDAGKNVEWYFHQKLHAARA